MKIFIVFQLQLMKARRGVPQIIAFSGFIKYYHLFGPANEQLKFIIYFAYDDYLYQTNMYMCVCLNLSSLWACFVFSRYTQSASST